MVPPTDRPTSRTGTGAPRSPRPTPPPQFDPNERFLTVGLVAEYFGVTEVTIKNWVDAGELLAARTVGGHRRIAASSVVSLLEEQGRSVPSTLARGKPLALIVDADVAYARTLRRTLAHRARTELASDDYGALLTAARLRPEVMVLDVHLPLADVRRMLAALKSDPVTKSIDVIAIGITAIDAKLTGQPPAEPGAARTNGGVVYFRRSEAAAIIEAVCSKLERPHSPTRRARRSRV